MIREVEVAVQAGEEQLVAQFVVQVKVTREARQGGRGGRAHSMAIALSLDKAMNPTNAAARNKKTTLTMPASGSTTSCSNLHVSPYQVQN